MRKPLKLKYKFVWDPELDPQNMSDDILFDIYKTICGFSDKTDEEFLEWFFNSLKEEKKKKQSCDIG